MSEEFPTISFSDRSRTQSDSSGEGSQELVRWNHRTNSGEGSSDNSFYDADLEFTMTRPMNPTPPATPFPAAASTPLSTTPPQEFTPPHAKMYNLLSDSPYQDPITPLRPGQEEECDGDTVNLDTDSSSSSSFNSSPRQGGPTKLTPRARRKWSQCANNLYISYLESDASGSEGDSSEEIKETSIDGIFIEFDHDIARIVDKKRCSHISALARVSCVHHGTPKFVKRRLSSLKSQSYEKMEEAKCEEKQRPHSAGSSRRVETPEKPDNVRGVSPLTNNVKSPKDRGILNRARMSFSSASNSVSDEEDLVSEKDLASELESDSEDELKHLTVISRERNEDEKVMENTPFITKEWKEEENFVENSPVIFSERKEDETVMEKSPIIASEQKGDIQIMENITAVSRELKEDLPIPRTKKADGPTLLLQQQDIIARKSKKKNREPKFKSHNVFDEQETRSKIESLRASMNNVFPKIVSLLNFIVQKFIP